MKQYQDLLKACLHGEPKEDRTGTGTRSIFGYQMRFNLQDGFPILTTKRIHFKSVVHELLWFISGDTNIQYLRDNGVSIWNNWADENGDLGPTYGHQWRHCPTYKEIEDNLYIPGREIDQLRQVIRDIKKTPDSRRLIVSSWNPAAVSEMALPPCHCLYQFYVNNGKLSCQLYQRSADVGLGVPFNIASYALLTHMVAQVCDLQVGDFIHTFGDVHIYKNHTNALQEQLKREPRSLPILKLNTVIKNIDDFRYEDIEIVGYNPYPHIRLEVSV